MSRRQQLLVPIVVALAISTGGGCLCWLTGDCDRKVTPPNEPTPASGSSNVPISTILSWKGGDSPDGSIVRHDVYLSATNPPVLYRPSVAGRTLTLDSLGLARTYFWQVVLIEEDGRNIVGPVWTFTTEYPPEFLSVAFPNWATYWAPGESRNIQWRSAYAGNNVRIELYKSGLNLCAIAESTPNDGIFEWTLTGCADRSDPDYRIKVTSLVDESVYDYSDFFTVRSTCPIEILAPYEGQTVITGQRFQLQWRPLGVSSNIKVALHLYKGSDFRYILVPVTPDDGAYDWIASDFSGGSANDYRIRIMDLNQLGCSQFGEFFSIHACATPVTSPVTDEVWPLGSQHTITWDPTGLPDFVELELYHDGNFVCVLDRHVPNTGAYLWTVTRCTSLFGREFQIRLVTANDGPCGFSGRFDLIN